MPIEFTNEPFTDFARPENRKAMEGALTATEKAFGREYPLWIAGQAVRTRETFTSTDPSRPDKVVGVLAKAGPEHAEKALDAAAAAFPEWSRTPAETRARVLFRGAAILRRRKFELSAWMVHEVGKNWAEADGDTAEAIDFLEFYAREMLRLSEPPSLTPVRGEENHQYYIPLGVGVVIPPWNFPLAILAGMTTAALVTGNTVVLKPASIAPVIAAQFVEAMHEAGLPPGVLQFLTGPGGTVGDVLVASPKTRFVAFTGSREVGVHIQELAGRTPPGQKWLKRVIAEMGGKDAIIVDRETDVAAAVEGVALSAFGYQGQKCSACSRAIVDRAVYDEFVTRLAERVRKITVGPPQDFAHWMGPVVDEAQKKKVLSYIEIGRKEGKLLVGGEPLPGKGHFIAPTVFTDVSGKARLAQEEIFGPVLSVIPADDFDHALALANDSDYGLTGAVYSRNRARLEQARREFHVGNLYLNRKCTGALVGAHPFGGFNLSGTDSKAGGRDYLQLFMQAKVVSERF